MDGDCNYPYNVLPCASPEGPAASGDAAHRAKVGEEIDSGWLLAGKL